MEKIKDIKELKVWQKGMEIVKDIYKATSTFPKEELYGLSAQMRRAAVSVPSNIAEGFKRHHGKEFKQFLYIAMGSTSELETQLIIAKELGFIGTNEFESITEKIDHLSKMLSSLIKKVSEA